MRHTAAVLGAVAACVAAAASATASAQARACPSDRGPRAEGVVLVVESPDARTSAWTVERLRGLGLRTWTEQRRVAQDAVTSAETLSIRYDGVRLRDVIAADTAEAASDRRWRTAVFEAVASDGYRAVFSWGELFNGAAGEQTAVVLAADGAPLDARAGPLALRALADQRPGPRHVRNLCALRVRNVP